MDGPCDCDHCRMCARVRAVEKERDELRDRLRGALSAVFNDWEYDSQNPKTVLAAVDRIRRGARAAFDAS